MCIRDRAYVIAEELGVSITRPRIVGKQTQRETHPVIVNDNCSYFRQSMYIPPCRPMSEGKR